MDLRVFLFQVSMIGDIDYMSEVEGENTRRPKAVVIRRLMMSKIRCGLYTQENRSYEKKTGETVRMSDMEKKKNRDIHRTLGHYSLRKKKRRSERETD